MTRVSLFRPADLDLRGWSIGLLWLTAGFAICFVIVPGLVLYFRMALGDQMVRPDIGMRRTLSLIYQMLGALNLGGLLMQGIGVWVLAKCANRRSALFYLLLVILGVHLGISLLTFIGMGAFPAVLHGANLVGIWAPVVTVLFLALALRGFAANLGGSRWRRHLVVAALLMVALALILHLFPMFLPWRRMPFGYFPILQFLRPLAAGYFLFVLIQLWRGCTAAACNVREQVITEEASK